MHWRYNNEFALTELTLVSPVGVVSPKEINQVLMEPRCCVTFSTQFRKNKSKNKNENNPGSEEGGSHLLGDFGKLAWGLINYGKFLL